MRINLFKWLEQKLLSSELGKSDSEAVDGISIFMMTRYVISCE